MKHRVESLNIFGEHLFKPKSETRQHPSKVDALLIKLGNTCFTRTSRWRNRTHLNDVADFFSAMVLRTEVHFERTWNAHGVVGGVRNERQQTIVDEQGLATVNFNPTNRRFVGFRQMTGNSVFRFVVVLVGVRQPIRHIIEYWPRFKKRHYVPLGLASRRI